MNLVKLMSLTKTVTGASYFQPTLQSSLQPKAGRSAQTTGLLAVLLGFSIGTSSLAKADRPQLSAGIAAADLANSPTRFHLLAQPAEQFPGVLLAQAEGDDAYDPFADYSEFEESEEEEEDINFFKNGRLLTVGFMGGYRSFSDVLGTIYSGSPTFGIFISYFFDLRFALQLGYLTSDHTLKIPARGTANAVQGTVGLSDFSVLTKYFFNTQNVTRGLADLNPYLIGGFSQVYRTTTVSGSSVKDNAFAFDIGFGIEVPLSRNKMYYGLQGMYQLINFSDEGSVFLDNLGNSTGVSPAGDAYTILAVLGVNF